MQHNLSLYLFLLFASSISCSDAICNQKDHQSLLAISLGFSLPSSPPLNWSSSSNTTNDCCLWEGVTCGGSGRVTRISLPSRGITGSISPFITNLSNLSHLNLSHNGLLGPLPRSFFASLVLLETLDLSFNRLDGKLLLSSARISLSASARTVDLSSNHFAGKIQSSFFELARSLVSFNVSNNSLTGPLPSCICTKGSPVKVLDFSANDFSSQIPSGLIGACSKIQIFSAGFNSLSGFLPNDMYDTFALREVLLPANKLSKSIDDAIVCLRNLKILELHYNELGGTIPREIGKLSKLEKVLLHSNYLSGKVPESLMNCTNLKQLNLRSNFLEGDISRLNFSKLPQLRVLDLGLNNFTGQLPMSLYSCKSLTAIRLSYNQLKGQVHPEILALKSLSFLAISHSMLTNVSGAIKILMGCENLRILILAKNIVHNEAIPDDNSAAEHSNTIFKSLQVLVVSGCFLTGKAPNWVARIRNLAVLDLSSNRLQGSIPIGLGNMPALFYIDFSENLISGEFPQELCQLPALTSKEAAAKADDTYLELPLFFSRNETHVNNGRDLQYNRLSNLPAAIYLRNNSLGGGIPQEIGQLKFLHMLDLSRNHFYGTIPDQLSNLSNLEKLDLSGNHLSGQIPASIGTLSFLSSFNVSYNDLEGEIPLGPQLQSFSASAYEGNAQLCGQPLQRRCRGAANDDEDIRDEEDPDIRNTGLYVSIGLGFFTGFWGVCATLVLKNSWRCAYFQFLTGIKDELYVMLTVHMIRLHRLFQR